MSIFTVLISQLLSIPEYCYTPSIVQTLQTSKTTLFLRLFKAPHDHVMLLMAMVVGKILTLFACLPEATSQVVGVHVSHHLFLKIRTSTPSGLLQSLIYSTLEQAIFENYNDSISRQSECKWKFSLTPYVELSIDFKCLTHFVNMLSSFFPRIVILSVLRHPWWTVILNVISHILMW